MSTGLRLELRQSQQLVMTPQLQQAIKLLQMSNLELAGFVEEQLAENPLLDWEGGDDPRGVRADPGAEPDGGPGRSETPVDSSDDGADRTLAEREPALATEVFDSGAENLVDASPSDGPAPAFGDAGWSRTPRGGGTPGEGGDWLADHAEPAAGLRAHVAAQIGTFRAPAQVTVLARALVEELDDGGYLRTPLAEAAARLGATIGEAESALALLQRCEPTGVGARDLGECLALQLAERNRLDPAMLTLTRNLDMVAAGETTRLRVLCGVDAADMAEMLVELRALDPRPCAQFGGVEAQTLIPDVHVRRTPWGGWHVELNADTLPRLIVDNTYAARIESGGGVEERRFVAGCRNGANWLIRSLDQRARTIVKVATEIVRRQEGFFAEGVRGLKPLNLRMVADAIGMHESTASRVTSGKYMATERGIFELKFFFTNAVGGGDAQSAEAVRHRIRGMIGAERPEAVLSDDTIVDRLKADGIDIARRTVAKYRLAMNIPSSVERRRQKALAAGG